MKLIDRIKRWPIDRKRFFSFLLAFFLTILIIIINFSLNSTWKNTTPINKYSNNDNSINELQESLTKILDEAKPAFDQLLGTSTNNVPVPTGEIIDQTNTASSSLSTSSNVVNLKN